MRKIFTILSLAFVTYFLMCGHVMYAAEDFNATSFDIEKAEEENVLTFQTEQAVAGSLYDNNINYMGLMILYAGIGDTRALETVITARNAKIAEQGLDYEQITLEDFLNNYEYYAGFSLNTDYSSLMKKCCINGDITAGREAEFKRNLKINTLGLDIEEISFDELVELSKIITAEAGSSWLPLEWKMMVGEVVLNRVKSVEFPNTVKEVIHQKGQYANANTKWFADMVPFEDCVDAAIRLLGGERIINNSSVVFQSTSRQGSGTYLELYDSYYGYTYLCYSARPELYE